MRNVISLLVVFASLIWGTAGHANEIKNVRVWPAPDNTRVVFDLASSPDYSYFTLYQATPYRLVIDFEGTALKVDLGQLQNESLLIKKNSHQHPKKLSFNPYCY